MIVGEGMVARALVVIDDPRIVFIAAGVSDSTCIDSSQFLRETILVESIISQHSDKLLVFFSTYSIYDDGLKSSPYVVHKLKLEEIFRVTCNNYLIVRAPNIIGIGGNPKNLFNYLYYSIDQEKHFKLWRSAFRNILLVDDFVLILNFIISSKIQGVQIEKVNIINENDFSVFSIVQAIEKHLQKIALYEIEEKISVYKYEDMDARNLFRQVINESGDYLEKILKKIYSK